MAFFFSFAVIEVRTIRRLPFAVCVSSLWGSLHSGVRSWGCNLCDDLEGLGTERSHPDRAVCQTSFAASDHFVGFDSLPCTVGTFGGPAPAGL